MGIIKQPDDAALAQRFWDAGRDAGAAGGGVVEVIGDRAAPYSTGYALTMPKDGSNIQMKSIDGFPHIIREDGLELLRSGTANDYEHRIAAYPAFVVKAPGWNGRFPV